MASSIPERTEIEQKYKWKLEDLYPDNEAWERDLQSGFKQIEALAAYQGVLEQGAKTLLDCLQFCDQLGDTALKVFAYARMRRDEDNRNDTYQSMTDRAAVMSTAVGEATAFVAPEVIRMGEKRIEEFIREEPELAVYRQYFHDILRESAHTLSQEEEKLLASAALIAEAPSDIYDMWSNADIQFGTIEGDDGEKKTLTQGNYISFLESSDREVRKRAFEALYAQYQAYENTLTATLSSNVKANEFYAKARKYDSAIHMSLSADNIALNVYDNLIDTVHQKLPLLKRYLKLRKRILGLDELHMYDLYTPMVAAQRQSVDYEQACETVLEALAPLGEEYTSQVRKALQEGWVDVYENQGKTPGAYSWGSNDAHPYVLLNYQGTLNDVFTLAHELGHAMHSFYTNAEQPSVYKNYRIFVAEVASTVNENLLMEHLIKTCGNDANRKAYLLNHRLEEFRTTLYRQTMFAEFEKQIHRFYEEDQPLTAPLLCECYRKLNEVYFAPEAVIDPEIAYEWARIPHFYSSFYVYQYATGYSAAVALADGILRKRENAVERYLAFLKGGSSAYPLDLLRGAGVDLSTPEPVQKALESFSATLDEMEKLLG